MRGQLARNWWVLALRGLAGVILGLMAFFWPRATLAAFVLIFGIYALVDGVFLVAAGLRAKHEAERWWAPVVEGVLSCIVGVMALVVPLATALAATLVIGGWAIATGILEIVAAIALRKAIVGEWLLAAVGVLSILLGVALFISPGAGLLALIWTVGAYALVSGVLLIGLAFRLRGRGATTLAASKPEEPSSRAA
jgi:uncharacterized membrane protein HdeD (DUF308 family)